MVDVTAGGGNAPRYIYLTDGGYRVLTEFVPMGEVTPVGDLEADRRRREAARRRRAELASERAQAAAKAKELLLNHLDKQQRKDFAKHDWFEVVGSATGNIYRIDNEISENVYWMTGVKNPRRLMWFCAYLSGVPTSDSLLGQKLTLEHNEDEFLAVANAWPYGGHRAPRKVAKMEKYIKEVKARHNLNRRMMTQW